MGRARSHLVDGELRLHCEVVRFDERKQAFELEALDKLLVVQSRHVCFSKHLYFLICTDLSLVFVLAHQMSLEEITNLEVAVLAGIGVQR